MIPRKPYITPEEGVRIHKRGTFDFSALYKSIRAYLEDSGYRKINFQEKESTAKEKALGRDLKIVFKASKPVDDYARFHIEIEMILEGLEKLKQNGKLLDKGFLQAKIKAFIMLDYKNQWNRSRVGVFLNLVYNNYIIKEKIGKAYIEGLADELTGLQDLIKEKLNLYLHKYGT